jgi:hypothetical protein
MFRARRRFELRQRCGVYFAPYPKASDSEIFENCKQPSDMVLMCASERDNVGLLEASRPQVRRHRRFSGIDSLRPGLAGETAECSALRQSAKFSTGRNDEERIALADVQYSEL